MTLNIITLQQYQRRYRQLLTVQATEDNQYQILKMLREFHSSVNKEPKLILKLLRITNEHGQHLGHVIANYYYDVRILKTYLILLQRLSLREDALPVFELLRMTTQPDEWHLGHLIAFYQLNAAAIKAYLMLLQNLTKQHAPHVVELLCMTSQPDEWHLGHLIAVYQQDASAMKAYLVLLQNLTTQGALQVLKILAMTTTTPNGWHVGHAIAQYQTDMEAHTTYLSLLLNFIDLQALQVLELLGKTPVPYGWHIGQIWIANRVSSDVFNMYFSLLHNLMERNAFQVAQLLSIVIKPDDWHLGHQLIFYQTETETLKKYWDLLHNLISKHAPIICQLLGLGTKPGNWHLGHLITYYTPQEMKPYFSLIQLLISSSPASVFTLLTQIITQSTDVTLIKFIHCNRLDLGALLEAKQPFLLKNYYELYFKAFLSLLNTSHDCLEYYRQYHPRLQVCLEYLPFNTDTLTLLKTCIDTDSNSRIGQFCALPIESDSPLITRKSLSLKRMIIQKIKLIESHLNHHFKAACQPLPPTAASSVIPSIAHLVPHKDMLDAIEMATLGKSWQKTPVVSNGCK